jgi:predicted alpha/beta-hydrolase family hydrolase
MTAEALRVLTLETPRGPGRAHVHAVDAPRALLVLGHGAGGGIGAGDLGVLTAAALAEGIAVALAEQPYRVAGRGSPAPAPALDEAFTAMIEELRARAAEFVAGRAGAARARRHAVDLPLFTGGRSSGARVACRTSAATGAVGVVCLAFPLLAPRRRDGTRSSRLQELDAVAVPALVIQGTGDSFGMPPEAPGRTVVQVAGDHSLRRDHAAIRAAARAWLGGQLA